MRILKICCPLSRLKFNPTSIIPRLTFKNYVLTFAALCIILTACDPNSGGPPYLTNVKAISAGYYHTLAIKDDGTLWAWGNNEYGQLGNGTTTNSLVAVQIGTANNWKAVSAGESHTVAVKQDDTVWAWGYNDFGQLGDGNIGTFSAAPIQVKCKSGVGNLVDVKAVSAGNLYTVAIKEDGSVWAWGYNNHGQLGDDGNSGTFSATPVQVMSSDDDGITITEFTKAIAVSTGSGHTVAIDNDDNLWAWGNNGSGRLGDGTTDNRNYPVQVMANASTEFNNIRAVSAGGSHTVAIDNGKNLWAWGNNSSGQLGDGTTIPKISPVQVMSDVKTVSAGYSHTVAIKEDGSVWAWGESNYGQLGDGTTTDRLYPVKIGDKWAEVSAGSEHTVAIKRDKILWAWGWNNNGQLGDGTKTTRFVPKRVMMSGL